MKSIKKSGITLLSIFSILIILSCGSPSDPSGPQTVADSTTLVGSWKFADDSDWLVVKSDGTFASKKLTGSWTAENEKLTLYTSTELVYGVRIGYASTLTWYYAALDGKLYKESTPFARVDESSGLTGMFERVEYRDDMSAFVKVQVEIRTDPDTLVYRMYSNTNGDYNQVTGAGTWDTTPAFELTGNIAMIPSATTGVVYELAVSGITPASPEFPDGTYTFLLYNEDALGVNLIGMVPFTSPVPAVYAAGYCVDGSEVEIPVYWLNGIRVNLAPLASGRYARASDIIISDSDVYVSGWCNNESNIKVAGYWKNGTWNSLSSVDPTKDSIATSISIWPGTGVHVGGFSIDSSDKKIPGHWWGGNWYALSKSDAGKDGLVNSIYLDTATGNIYNAGVNTDSSGKSLPGYWKYVKATDLEHPENSVWVGMTPDPDLSDYTVNSIYVDGTKVYACGSGVNGSGVSRGVYWVDGAVTEETTKANTEVSSCSDIQAVEGRVYTAGSVTSATRGVLGIVRKNGADGPDNDMYDLPALSEPKKSRVGDIQILSSGDVLVGGDSMNAMDIFIPGYWKNKVWVELPRISSAKLGSVRAIWVVE